MVALTFIPSVWPVAVRMNELSVMSEIINEPLVVLSEIPNMLRSLRKLNDRFPPPSLFGVL